LQTEVIYDEELVRVVDAQAPYSREITLQQYLAAEYIGLAVMEGNQNIPEKRLAAHGERRRTVMTLPYFAAAARCVPQSGPDAHGAKKICHG
jgi:DNA-binding transcriptional LysR family regulator